jgi:hypothetical protein
MRTFSIATLLICFLNSFSFAQKGQLSGKVTDAKTGEEMVGAAVVVDGTSIGAVTDLEGKYTFSVDPGIYTIKVTLIGYLSQTIKDVNVSAGKTEVINISIQSGEATNIAAAEVTAKALKHSEGGVLLLQKNNVSVSDVISSVAISKTPDKTTSDVLKRVSGASIQDNKFAVIRGMNDRYNAAYLNGAPLPSSESDRKAFAFDIFPSNLLDNLVIVKTATPDLPGEFAGGVIQVNTKSIPEKSQRTVSLSTGYNSLSTFKDFRTYNGGKTDFLGLDDGTRAMPSQIPSTEEFKTMDRDQKALLGKNTAGDWSLMTRKAGMPFSLQYTKCG